MNDIEVQKRLQFLNDRINRNIKGKWYRWAVRITWDKIIRWSDKLGYGNNTLKEDTE